MNKELFAEALYALADCCAATSGNMHTLHLNFQGREFDEMHKRVFQEYYEQLDNDYDSLAEWGRCYGAFAPNKNESAARIGFHSIGPEGVGKDDAVVVAGGFLEELLNQFNILFHAAEEIKDCPIATGIANFLQTRIEYWAKEVYFFNANREEPL